MSLRKRRKSSGIIWVYPPPKPLSPHQERRAAEFALILELATWLGESWVGRAEHDDELAEAPIALLLAATRWLCLLDLPNSDTDLFHGPPVLSRVAGSPEVTAFR